LLNDNSTLVSFAAVIYSIAVTIGIFAFWSLMMRLLPFVFDRVGRTLLFGVMAVGSVMIVAMSAWLNATALAGKAALEQHLAATLQDNSRDLDQAYRYATSAQGLLPDIQMASARFGQLADEREDRYAHGDVGFRHGGAATNSDVEPAGHVVADRPAIKCSGKDAVRRG
jgi:hypothetical protein